MNSAAFRGFSQIFNGLVSKFRLEAPLKNINQKAVAKVAELNSHYTKFIGLDEVRQYQDRVVALQERLLKAQDDRREIGRQLAQTRKLSNQLQDELHKVRRQDDIDRFLQLMKEETDILRQEREIAGKFQECDQSERELFTAFTNAIRDSHEKQRAQLEYTKYFGIILSIAGSFLAFCYTSLRKDDLKRFIEESMARGNQSNDTLAKIQSILNTQQSNNDRNRFAVFQSKPNEVVIDASKVVYYVGIGVLIVIVLKMISN